MSEKQSKYQIIYADPPWPYDGNEVLAKTSRLNLKKKDGHYGVMSFDDIARLPVSDIADDNSLLFLWVVSPSLDRGIDILKSWGFKFATVAFVWNKKRTNPGYYTLSSCELVLVGKKGKIPTPRGERNIEQFLSSLREGHSVKPAEIRNRISKMFPTQRKIELFARDDAQNNLFGWDKFAGWDVFGNEVEDSIIL